MEEHSHIATGRSADGPPDWRAVRSVDLDFGLTDLYLMYTDKSRSHEQACDVAASRAWVHFALNGLKERASWNTVVRVSM